ncbi:BQ5605_C004g03121 [Microbotryum silenes-dioicae]|uniref:BQ5605_C004g03121 protein n=1 Tax=Microbotryum silenes-dioicae TaxID=796604 RepID=A0A2X0P5A4_9BASI|nr:BQ5605_C004g03121 [Microbotryum silenes-dioicae]
MQSKGAIGTLRWHVGDIVGTGGMAGLYRAIAPTVLRAGILTASQLGTYDHAKHTLMNDFPDTFREGFRTHFIASGVAGFTCSIVSSPVDVVKVGRQDLARRAGFGILAWTSLTRTSVHPTGSNDVGCYWAVPKHSPLRGHGIAERRPVGLLSGSHHVLLAPLAAFGPFAAILRKFPLADRFGTHLTVV